MLFLADGTLSASWLGVPHRPWLDFPGALAERDDIGVREVLRDLWSQRDDPRGEFAALSAAAAPSPKMRARAAELVLAHGRGWLGPLQKVIPFAGALFGPGPFLRKAIVYFTDEIQQITDAVEWGTVEEIVFANTSKRFLFPSMKNLRVVGPLAAEDLAAEDLALFSEGTWRVEEIDFEVTGKGALEALAVLDLPLKRLRLRASEAPSLAALARASWWKSLTRCELWLPGAHEDPEAATAEAFDALAASLPAGCTVAVGQLTGGQRSGWMLVGAAGESKKDARRLELLLADARTEQGPALADALGLKLPDTWDSADAEEWLVYGLGLSA